jgi:hypothetical protein
VEMMVLSGQPGRRRITGPAPVVLAGVDLGREGRLRSCGRTDAPLDDGVVTLPWPGPPWRDHERSPAGIMPDAPAQADDASGRWMTLGRGHAAHQDPSFLPPVPGLLLAYAHGIGDSSYGRAGEDVPCHTWGVVPGAATGLALVRCLVVHRDRVGDLVFPLATRVLDTVEGWSSPAPGVRRPSLAFPVERRHSRGVEAERPTGATTAGAIGPSSGLPCPRRLSLRDGSGGAGYPALGRRRLALRAGRMVQGVGR